VTVDGLPVKSGHKLKPGEVVEILSEESTPDIELEPQEIKLNIIYEDSQVIVIDKPAGLTVHPGAASPRDAGEWPGFLLS